MSIPDVGIKYIPGHFEERCRQRLPVEVDVGLLYRGLVWAVQNCRDDLVERVVQSGEANFYRFRLPSGHVMYAAFKMGRSGREYPITVYTGDMFSNRRKRIKARKKKRTARARRGKIIM